MSIKSCTQRGDTIVEILIVLAILGLALSIAYTTANRSLQGARQAQEHSEALELVQGQIEQMRAVAETDASVFDTTKHTNGFCINSGSIVDLSNSDLTQESSYTPTPPNPGSCINGLYDLSITNLGVANPTQADTFRVEATWFDVRGSGKDIVSMTYKLHQEVGP